MDEVHQTKMEDDAHRKAEEERRARRKVSALVDAKFGSLPV